MVDLMGRLSNPPEALDCHAEQGLCSKAANVGPPVRPQNAASCDIASPLHDNPGRLSNPVQRRLPATKIKLIVKMYVAGCSIDSLARQFGVHRTTVIHHLRVSGVPRRKVVRKLSDHLVAEARTRYGSGLSLAKVAFEFDVHPRTLRREFVKAGVEIRSRM